MRATGHLAEEVAKTRDASLSASIYLPKAGKGVSYISMEQAISIGVDLFKSQDYEKDENHCRFLAFRNETVDFLNQQFRKKVGVNALYLMHNRIRCNKPVTRLSDDMERDLNGLRKIQFNIFVNMGDTIKVISPPTSIP
ncbi:hypothetical protein [Okeania sp. KiyG1]|uniref:hypothetical protein n=1 Tax=Okeania sp. KiyG1 TaxID=2720165 RepID=UPI0019239D3A|nr:hypothetical protein [Okeania sp. KiyG1]GGA13982.1 hypothetical protein CYANOKiyG1_27490 [Okeania sp. KiyG1]